MAAARHEVRAPASFPGAPPCPPTEVRCMSSLAHDRLLPEGPAPRKRAGSALATAGGTRTRRVSVPAAETDPTGAATPRRRTAQRSEGPATGRRVAATATKETVSKAARTAATATRTARAKAAETAASTVTAAKA